MSSKFKLILSTLFLVALLFGLVQPAPVHALPVATITPNVVVNNIANTITIACTDFTFTVGARVYVGVDETGVTSRVIDATTLEAIIPQGFTPGIHTIKVINPDASVIYIEAGLTVEVPPTPEATPTAQPFARPQLAVKSYSTNATYGIIYGQDFTLIVRLANFGGSRAYGVQVTFGAPELLMMENGGVVTKGSINKGDSVDIGQKMTAVKYFYGQDTTSVEMTVSYYDDKGVQYSDKFTLNLGVYDMNNNVVSATATPTGVHHSQLVVSGYKTDVELLQPGLQFKLELTINNMGDLPAKAVTMIVGGGSSSSGGGGTPGPGGVSGSSGDFSNFAPVGTSNVQPLGDVPAKSSLVATQQLIVNVNTSPGAYPMKITLSYTDSHGIQVNDEQVITLLVFSLPNVEIGFYQPVTDLYTNQSNLLPLQVINMGRKTAILGNMTVTSKAGTVENSQAFVGSLEPGGYFTLDVTLTPAMAGEAEVLVTIHYTDDFNTARSVTKTMTVNVVEMQVDPSLDPNNPNFNNGGNEVMQPETTWQKIVRFVLGLFGLDSSAPAGGSSPIQVEPTTPQIKPVPYNGGKG